MATSNNEIIEVLKTIAPGTQIREGLENILKAKTGGLIVIGDGKEVMDIRRLDFMSLQKWMVQ